MKPVIGYDNFFTRFRSGIDPGQDATGANLGNWLTGPDSVWQIPVIGQSISAEVSVTLPSSMSADYFAVARHSLAGRQISVWRMVGSQWSFVASHTPVDSDAFLIPFSPVTSSQWRVLVNVQTPGQFMGVCAIGTRLELERGVFVGHDPITENERTVSVDNLSESGQFLGRKIIRMGAQSSIDPGNISADWARDHWRPFRKHAQKYPFFWQWNPKHHDDEVALCWQSSDPSLSNSGVGYLDQKGRIDLSMPINGIVR